jgi:hypothetical protein
MTRSTTVAVGSIWRPLRRETWRYVSDRLVQWRSLDISLPDHIRLLLRDYEYEDGVLVEERSASYDSRGHLVHEDTHLFHHGESGVTVDEEWRQGSLQSRTEFTYSSALADRELNYDSESGWEAPWMVWSFSWSGEHLVSVLGNDGSHTTHDTYSYDSLGRLSRVIREHGNEEQLYSYDSSGLRSITHGVAGFVESETLYSYSPNGQLSRLEFAEHGFTKHLTDFTYSGRCKMLPDRLWPCVHPVWCRFVLPENGILW